MKKIIVLSFTILFISSTVSAQTNSIQSSINCVGSAAMARETTLSTNIKNYNDSIDSAYRARRDALQKAYNSTNRNSLTIGVRNAWSTFNVQIKIAKNNWKKSKNIAWSQYKAAVKACKASSWVNDSSHSSSEISGG